MQVQKVISIGDNPEPRAWCFICKPKQPQKGRIPLAEGHGAVGRVVSQFGL